MDSSGVNMATKELDDAIVEILNCDNYREKSLFYITFIAYLCINIIVLFPKPINILMQMNLSLHWSCCNEVSLYSYLYISYIRKKIIDQLQSIS